MVCKKCGCELNGEAAFIIGPDEIWCHTCADAAKRPDGSNADEWHLFLSEYLDNRATSPSGLPFIAMQIAEAIDNAERRGAVAQIGWHTTGPDLRAAVLEVAQDNTREAWSALAMIRETVETIGPVGAMQASEHLDGPTFMHEAEAVVKGIRLLVHGRPSASEARLKEAITVLEQCQDCIRGETPEGMTTEEAREDTIRKIREIILA